MRATSRYAPTAPPQSLADRRHSPSATVAASRRPHPSGRWHAHVDRPDQRQLGPAHRLLEGTVIDTVLTNRLDGSDAAPVELPRHERRSIRTAVSTC